jgi:transcriptional regulator with XRE-family HTH domain
MAQLRSPTLVTLGRMVRTFRDAAGLTQKEFAKKLGYTNGWVSNVENAQLRPRSEQVTAMERALGVPPGALMNVYEQLDGEVLPGWFREWVDEESQADVLRAFELSVIPGLLQTESYACALLPGDEAGLAKRMKRQDILAEEKPPMFYVVLDEAVLYHGRGGTEVMQDQLEHLIASVSPRLTVQIVLSEMNPRPRGAFTIATVEGGDVAYVETAIRGVITSSREDLTELAASWETIRTFALSQQESLNLIRKVIDEKWT